MSERQRRLPANPTPTMPELKPGPPQYFLMRARRMGPLVPARLWWCDYEPGEPTNKLDRGNLSPYPRADIAGDECDPLELRERLAWPQGHWKYCQPITETEYRYQVQHLRWAENNRPDDPRLTPKQAVDPSQLALPNFDRENAA
jgi:hypothetical protein